MISPRTSHKAELSGKPEISLLGIELEESDDMIALTGQ